MKPLISIETIPISIEYTSTKAQRTRQTQSQSAKLSVSQDRDRVAIQGNPIQIQLQDRFEQSVQSYMAYTATAEYSGNGILRMNVQLQDAGSTSEAGITGETGAADSNPYRFQAVGGDIDRMVDAVDRTPAPSRSVMPFISMKIDFDLAQLSSAPDLQRAAGMDTSFIPPDLEIEIVEYPKVIIKYIGGPIYFPRSADPNYEPPRDQADGGFDSNFEAKA
jgi:hypothetical protein